MFRVYGGAPSDFVRVLSRFNGQGGSVQLPSYDESSLFLADDEIFWSKLCQFLYLVFWVGVTRTRVLPYTSRRRRDGYYRDQFQEALVALRDASCRERRAKR